MPDEEPLKHYQIYRSEAGYVCVRLLNEWGNGPALQFADADALKMFRDGLSLLEPRRSWWRRLLGGTR